VPGATLFYKEVRTDETSSAEKNTHVKQEAATELAVLNCARQAAGASEFIVRLAAEIDMGISGVGLVLELAHCDFRDMYFSSNVDKELVLLPRDKFGGAANVLTFLKTLERFFTQVADYLRKQSLVYCDWKFENILCFHTTPVAVNYHFKLTDFGAALAANVSVTNPNNTNPMFASPSFARANPTIRPTFSDDYKSISYMFYKLNYKRLPWEINYNVSKLDEAMLNSIIAHTGFLKTWLPTQLNIYDASLTYWPARTNEIFHVLAASAQYTLPKKRKKFGTHDV
jgi:serine/threonine protein kinase